MNLSDAEKEPFYEHVDPSNSDASAEELITHVEKILKSHKADAWEEGYDCGWDDAELASEGRLGDGAHVNPYEEKS